MLYNICTYKNYNYKIWASCTTLKEANIIAHKLEQMHPNEEYEIYKLGAI